MVKHLKWMLKDLMIQATFASTLCFCIAHPQVHLMLMRGIDSKFMAMQGIVISLATICCNSAFNKWGDKIFKLFPYLCIVEVIAYGVVVPLIAFGFITPKVYYVLDMVAYACITRNMVCSGNRLRRLIYDRETREKYDNSAPIANASACVLGGAIAMLTFPVWLSWIFLFIGISVDNVFYFIIYKKTVK